MAYCTYDEVKLIIATSMASADITSLIVLADAEIDARELDGRAADIKKRISMFLTAELIALKQPGQANIGPLSSSPSTSTTDWRKLAENLILRSGEPPIEIVNDPLPNE